MTALRWQWHERDFGFRFRSGAGRKKGEYYQAASAGEFYLVPGSQRKLPKERLEDLATLAVVPTSPRVVPTPWRDYDRDWDWITTADGILLNFAGCVDKEEIHRRDFGHHAVEIQIQALLDDLGGDDDGAASTTRVEAPARST